MLRSPSSSETKSITRNIAGIRRPGGVGHGRVPGGGKGGEKRVQVRGAEDKISRGGVELGKGVEGAGCFVGVVDADGDDVEGALAVHAVHGLNFGHFLNARSAPGGPEIHQQEFAGGVGAQGLETVGADRIDVDGNALDLGECGLASFFFVHPLGGAADGGSLCDGHGLVRKERVDGVASIADGDERFARIVVQTAGVAELALRVEEEKVRSGGGAIGARDALRFAVVEVGKVEVAVGGADFHVVERVANVGIAQLVETHSIGIIGLDSNEGHVALTIVGHEPLDAGLVELSGGAMIASEDDDEDFARGVVLEAVGLAVNSGKAKLGSRGADGENGDGFVGGQKKWRRSAG